MKTRIIFFFSILTAFTTQAFSQQMQAALDGKQYKIELMKDGTLDSKETLVFDQGTMDPLNCHQWGFTTSKYEAKNSGALSTFHVTCKSDKEGTMTWQGKVTGQEIEGTVVWDKTGQNAIRYTFKGKEAVPEK